MIHSNLIVKDAIFIYSMVIRFLINNRDDVKRAEKAYQYALELA
jgi:hypothetical protein